MIVPLDVRCLECRQIFCCSECRIKHEKLQHDIEYDCKLCRFRSTTLNAKKMSEQLIDHICSQHLPLHCKKCNKLFDKKEDIETGFGPCCSDTNKQSENESHDVSMPLPESLQVTPKNSLSPSRTNIIPAQDGKILDYLKIKLKDKSEVMTSTPTHPSTNKEWGIFQKSFTSSTLSGINSPNSDVVQSPPADDNVKARETNSPSEILSTIDSPPSFPATALKGIITKVDKGSPSLVGGEGTEPRSPDVAPGDSGIIPECSNNSSNKTPQDSSSRKKSVTFADQVLAPRRKTVFEFLKPKRTCTPGKLRQSHVRTPRFQAIINNFEAKANCKEFTTPKQNRFVNPEETPPTTVDTNTNVITGRTIQFKQDSPTLDSLDTSPVTSQEKMTIKVEDQNKDTVEIKPFAVISSPLEKDLTDLDHYKSCIESPELFEKSITNKNQVLPQLIAKSIQESLNSALNSQDYTTEIQLSIKITKKTVSINEKKKVFDQVGEIDKIHDRQKGDHVENESTTIWSRLISGLKWVVWGEDGRWNYSPQRLKKTRDEEQTYTESIVTPGVKRKRHTAYVYGDSPVSKRYRGIDKIRGRRPLDRAMLRGGVALPERCQSTDVNELRELENPTENDMLNRSF